MLLVDDSLIEWLILLVAVPVTVVPVVLLWGFAGCSSFSDASPPEPPTNLKAQALSSNRIRLTWDYPLAGPTVFTITRVREGQALPDRIFPVTISGTPSVEDDQGLSEGTTYTYTVATGKDPSASTPSAPSLATTFPITPSNLIATPSDVGAITVTWANTSSRADQVILSDAVTGAAVSETKIPIGSTPPVTWTLSVLQGTDHQISIQASVKGFDAGALKEVRSLPSSPVAAKPLALKATLDSDQNNRQGRCLVQRIPRALLRNRGSQLYLRVRGSSANSLTIDRIFISQAAAAGDFWDSAPAGPPGGLTRILNRDLGDPALFLPAGTGRRLGPVAFAIDQSADLIVAFDISATGGQGNLIKGTLAGATAYQRTNTQEAAIANRSAGYATEQNSIYLIEAIEVL